MSIDIMEQAKKIPTYHNVRALFEDPDGLADDFWKDIKTLGEEWLQIRSIYNDSERKIPPLQFLYKMNPAGQDVSMSAIAPVDITAKYKHIEGYWVSEGTRIQGIVFSTGNHAISPGKTYGAMLNFTEDLYFTVGPTVRDQDFIDSVVEVLERPHLFEREGDYVISHYICPSPEFLSQRYPDLYTSSVLDRVIRII